VTPGRYELASACSLTPSSQVSPADQRRITGGARAYANGLFTTPHRTLEHNSGRTISTGSARSDRPAACIVMHTHRAPERPDLPRVARPESALERYPSSISLSAACLRGWSVRAGHSPEWGQLSEPECCCIQACRARVPSVLRLPVSVPGSAEIWCGLRRRAQSGQPETPVTVPVSPGVIPRLVPVSRHGAPGPLGQKRAAGAAATCEPAGRRGSGRRWSRGNRAIAGAAALTVVQGAAAWSRPGRQLPAGASLLH
jgi:hypothetical protein